MSEKGATNNGINISIPENLPKSIDNAITKVTDKPAEEVGNSLTEYVKFSTRVGKVINALFSNVDRWALIKEYNYKETKVVLENKLKYIEENKIVSPENYIAIPVLQALSYSMDNDELRNLFANILANAMNSDIKDKVRPAFVDIIKQLSPIDVRLFNYIGNLNQNNRLVECVHIELVNVHANSLTFPYVICYNEKAKDIVVAIENLMRCNLLYDTISRGYILDVPDDYYAINSSEDKISFERFENWNSLKPYFEQGYVIENVHFCGIDLTELGKEFYTICCS